eukprot:13571269-Alexandrium_andersonii.AAC.1
MPIYAALEVRLSNLESLAISARKPDSQGRASKKGRSTRTSLAIPTAVGPEGSGAQHAGSDPQVRLARLGGLQAATGMAPFPMPYQD